MVAPKNKWERSSVTAQALEQAANEGLLPPASERRWRIASADPRPRPSPGEFVAFLAFLERGLGFPTSEFFRRFLDFYGLQVHDLTPNSILHLACFVTLCEGYFGCAPFFPLWLWIFHGKLGKGGDMAPCGGLNFQVRGDVDYLDLSLPSKVYWRKSGFYMREPAPDGEIGIPCFSPSPSRPRNLQELPRDADLPMVRRLMARLQELKNGGLTGLNLVATWVKRKIAPL